MRVLIADDEPLARRRLHDLLDELGGCEIVAEARDGREACEQAATLAPDVAILDIAMPVLDGLEAAHHLAELDSPPAVIFCTAYDEHALAAFDAHAVDYLVKPIRAERLATALERAARLRTEPKSRPRLPAARRTHLSARLRGMLRLIPVPDIHYLMAEEKYVTVHHHGGVDLIEDSLKSLEAEFGDTFLRIHRNCLVAPGCIRELSRDDEGREVVRLRHGDEALEVSRRCLPAVRKYLRTL